MKIQGPRICDEKNTKAHDVTINADVVKWFEISTFWTQFALQHTENAMSEWIGWDRVYNNLITAEPSCWPWKIIYAWSLIPSG